MSMLRNKKGTILIEAIIALSIILITVTLALQSVIVNFNIQFKLDKEKQVYKSIELTRNIIVYNTQIEDLKNLIDKESLYIKLEDLEKYKGQSIKDIISNEGDFKINFNENNGFIDINIVEVKKGEKFNFIKGNY